jgi:hypothetical protein
MGGKRASVALRAAQSLVRYVVILRPCERVFEHKKSPAVGPDRTQNTEHRTLTVGPLAGSPRDQNTEHRTLIRACLHAPSYTRDAQAVGDRANAPGGMRTAGGHARPTTARKCESQVRRWHSTHHGQRIGSCESQVAVRAFALRSLPCSLAWLPGWLAWLDSACCALPAQSAPQLPTVDSHSACGTACHSTSTDAVAWPPASSPSPLS